MTVISNNYSDAYSYNNKDGKLFYFIKTFSPLVISFCIYGLYKLFYSEKKYLIAVFSILTIVVPTFMFWQVQSFELHHYTLCLLSILMLYCFGVYYFLENRVKLFSISACFLLLLQSSLTFTSIQVPGFCSLHRIPKILDGKEEIVKFANYLKEISKGGKYIYMASGSGVLNIDLIKNSLLPSLDMPYVLNTVFDIRDGFPKNLKYVDYVIITDPTLYFSKDDQHIYDIITHAITSVPCVRDKYEYIYTTYINGVILHVYHRIAEYNDEVMRYFYNEILSFYPDRGDYFSYLLED